MENVYELLYDPEVTEGVFGISLVKDPAIQIEALQFSTEDITDEELKKVSNYLINLGEKEEGPWTLIDSTRVDHSFQFSEIESSIDSLSEQDSTLFKVRYAYAPGRVNLKSRQFCKDIIGANKVYRKEDIEKASSQGVNGQFAPKGESKYDIFLYKGGVNCKHFWERRIYLRDNTRINQKQALAMIHKMPTEDRDQFRFPTNNPKVAQSASASNNYWRLSSEEKRILVSPVLIPDQKVFRKSLGKEGKPGYVFVTAETIEQLQQNFFKQNYQHNSTIEHLYPIEEGVFIFESWIIEDPENDKAKALGFDLPKGTWMVSMKIDNNLIWEEYIKTGKIGGLSMDASLKSEKVITQEVNFKNQMKKETLKSMLTKALAKRVAFNADMKEFVVGEGQSVFATELVEGAIVTDVDGKIMPEIVFDYEGKRYRTGVEGEIVSIEDIVEDVEMSDEMLEEVLEEVKNDIVAEYEKQIEALNAEIAELKLKLAETEVKVEEAVEFSKQTPGSKGIRSAKGPKQVRGGVLGAL